MKVLSLFDGISCGMVALERAGIKVDRYVAYEIDKYAIEISKYNYPQIEHCGDVTVADFTKYKGFDLVIGGSPCQDLCCCGSREGLKGAKSSLFYHFVRALKEVNPKYWMLENNATMTKINRDIITNELGGITPVFINSNLVSAQDRKRLYWCNFNVGAPDDRHILLQDILQPREEKQEYDITDRVNAKVVGTLAHHKAWTQIRHPNEKMRCLTTSMNISNSGATNIMYEDGRIYKPTPTECERAQTLPDNYTKVGKISNTQRYKTIGNGWTVDVIAHILKGLHSVEPQESEG